MDVLTAALAILLLAIIVLAYLLTKSNRDGRPEETASQPPPNKDTVLFREGRSAPPQPAPFDAGTARPVGVVRQPITGPAYVIDGDTIVISKTQIRLFGIDAPELDHPYGKRAKAALRKLCKGHFVTAVITDRDDYGRTIAKCNLPDGRDLSAEMVKLGLAIDWHKFFGGAYRALEVSDARKKLWLADARQKGRMHVWERYEARRKPTAGTD